MKIKLLIWLSLYNVLFTLLIPWDGLRLRLRARKMPGAHHRWTQRLGFNLPVLNDKPVIWLHAVSLGEVNLSVPLINALLIQHPDHHLLVTTTTFTGANAVTQHFADKVTHCYFPYDHPWSSRRFIKHFKPKIMIIMETEIWPNHVSHCQQQHIPVCILNARLSVQSAQGYKKIQTLVNLVWNGVTHIGAQTQDDKQRFIDLGCPENKISVMGNIKYEIAIKPELFQQANTLRASWGTQRPVWVAASTHEGEEKIILDTFTQLKQTLPACLLILVPRHPQRFADVAELAKRYTPKLIQRSHNGDTCTQDNDIYLIDTVGELNLFYAASDVAFVGGSLVPIGGHNVIEAAAYECAAITGAHTFNFTKVIADFESAEALIIVNNSHELLEKTQALLTTPAQRQALQSRALMLLKQHQGGVSKCLLLLNSLIK